MKLNNWFKISYVSRDITYKTFIVILSILIVFKFFLIRESEIIAHPKDAYLYILIAKQKIWFPEYMNTNAYTYNMGYPLFIILSNILKIPLRIGHEIFYIFSNLLLIYGLRLLKIPRIVCVLVFSVLTFHLSTFQYFNTAMTESIVISLYHIVIGLMILIITSKRSTYKLLYSIISGLVLGFILITRQETFIIYLCYLSLTLLILLDGRRRIYLAMPKVIYTVIIPMIMSLLLVYFVSSLNYLFTGVPGL